MSPHENSTQQSSHSIYFFPLPENYFIVPPYHPTHSRRQRARQAERRGVAQAANDAVRALNWLSGGAGVGTGHTGGERSYITPTPVQASFLCVIREITRDAWRRGVFRRDRAPVSVNFAYYAHRATFQNLRVGDLALPSDGLTGTVDLLSVLPPDILPFFAHQGLGLRAGSNPEERETFLAEARSRRYGWGAGDGADYGQLIRRLIETNMVELGLFPAQVINGLFGVPKPSASNPLRQRLITDARPCNTMFEMPWRVRLPNPSSFANLRIPAGSRVWFFQCDVESMFHRFAVPDWMADLQGLPPLRASDLGVSEVRIWDVGWSAIGPGARLLPAARLSTNGGPISYDIARGRGFVGEFDVGLISDQSDSVVSAWASRLDRRLYRRPAFHGPTANGSSPSDFRLSGDDVMLHPRIRTMPMGWTGSVHCAQGILEYLVEGVTPRQAAFSMLRGNVPHWLEPGEVTQSVYVDDFAALGLEPGLVNEQGERVMSELRAKGLHENPDKTVTATANQQRVTVLGTEITGGRIFGPDRDGLRRLIQITRAMLRADWVAGDYVRSLQGHWIWVGLCNRPFLSVFENTYRYARVLGARPGRLWHSVRREFETAIALAPFLYMPMDSPFHTRVYATDASSRGGGTTYTQARDEREVYNLLRDSWGIMGNAAGDRERALSGTVGNFVEGHD